MPSWFFALMFGIGIGGWLYNKLAHMNGNAVPRNNMIGAAFAGIVAFLFFLSILSLLPD